MGQPRKAERRTVEVTQSVQNGIALAKRHRFTPLDVLLGIGNKDPRFADWEPHEVNCMIAAAPFVHPKLAAVAFQEQPNEAAEKRRDLLGKLSYHQRQEILRILAAAEASDAQQIEGAAEAVMDDAEKQR